MCIERNSGFHSATSENPAGNGRRNVGSVHIGTDTRKHTELMSELSLSSTYGLLLWGGQRKGLGKAVRE